MPVRFYFPTAIYAWNLCRKFGRDFYEIKRFGLLPLGDGRALGYNYLHGYYVQHVM